MLLGIMISAAAAPFWRRLFRRDPPHIYLGQLTAAPRTDLLRLLEGSGSSVARDTDLRTYLADWLQLPKASSAESARDSDLALDVLVKRYRLGQLMVGEPIPVVFWRPMVEITSRAYFLKSGKDFLTIEVRHRMPWRQYLRRLSLRFWFSPSPAATKEDMQLLLGEALLKVIGKLKARV